MNEGADATLNLPLPQGTDWEIYSPALQTALGAIASWEAAMLVVSFGADTYADDPISHFALGQADFKQMAAAIAELNLPTLIVLEGGFAIHGLSENVKAFLSRFT